MKAVVVAVAAMLTLGSFANAQTNASNYSEARHFTLALGVTATEGISTDIQSYLSRYFRQLGDVTMSDDKPNYLIMVNVLPTLKDDSGYAVSIIACEPIDSQMVSAYINLPEEDSQPFEKLTQRQVIRLDSILAGAVRIKYNSILSGYGGLNGIEDLCKRTVNAVDSELLEPDRRSYQDIVRKIKENERKKQLLQSATNIPSLHLDKPKTE